MTFVQTDRRRHARVPTPTLFIFGGILLVWLATVAAISAL
jgi:acyl-CoA hydrolase